MQAGAVLFAYLIYGHHGAAQPSQTAEFLLDFLEPFMPLPVSHLVRGSMVLLLPILLVQLMDLSDLRPQAHDFFPKDC